MTKQSTIINIPEVEELFREYMNDDQVQYEAEQQAQVEYESGMEAQEVGGEAEQERLRAEDNDLRGEQAD